MTKKINDLIENDQIREFDLVEFVNTYNKLVKLNVLSEKQFQKDLKTFGIQQKKKNTFVLNDETEYTLN